jgi:hypothetical protein
MVMSRCSPRREFQHPFPLRPAAEMGAFFRAAGSRQLRRHYSDSRENFYHRATRKVAFRDIHDPRARRAVFVWADRDMAGGGRAKLAS